MIVLGVERTIEQDPAFAVRIMVDIAIRALSPAVNDPTTAVQVLNHLGDLLHVIGAVDFRPAEPAQRSGSRALAHAAGSSTSHSASPRSATTAHRRCRSSTAPRDAGGAPGNGAPEHRRGRRGRARPPRGGGCRARLVADLDRAREADRRVSAAHPRSRVGSSCAVRSTGSTSSVSPSSATTRHRVPAGAPSERASPELAEHADLPHRRERFATSPRTDRFSPPVATLTRFNGAASTLILDDAQARLTRPPTTFHGSGRLRQSRGRREEHGTYDHPSPLSRFIPSGR